MSSSVGDVNLKGSKTELMVQGKDERWRRNKGSHVQWGYVTLAKDERNGEHICCDFSTKGRREVTAIKRRRTLEMYWDSLLLPVNSRFPVSHELWARVGAERLWRADEPDLASLTRFNIPRHGPDASTAAGHTVTAQRWRRLKLIFFCCDKLQLFSYDMSRSKRINCSAGMISQNATLPLCSNTLIHISGFK